MEEQINHPDMVATLCKKGEEILGDLTPGSYSLLRETILQAIAIGARIDLVKKQVVYNKDMGLGPTVMHAFPELTGEQCHLLHMAVGMFGEAAELLEAVFNHVDTGAPLDRDNLVEELWDSAFYEEGLRQGAGITREEALEGNISKLGARYRNFVYSDQAAQDRADKG